jgi:hypothetical protein
VPEDLRNTSYGNQEEGQVQDAASAVHMAAVPQLRHVGGAPVRLAIARHLHLTIATSFTVCGSERIVYIIGSSVMSLGRLS